MLYESNMNAVLKDIVSDYKRKVSPLDVSRKGAQQLLGDIKHRIHIEGKNANDSAIAGSYSTEPIYISIEGFVRQTNGKGGAVGQPRGKNSDNPVFNNGKKRKSRYFKKGEGYKQFVQEQTGNTKVNLSLTRQLENDLKVSKEGRYFGLGFSDYGLDIYEGLENHYNAQIWFPTTEERNRMIVAIEDYIIDVLNGKL